MCMGASALYEQWITTRWILILVPEEPQEVTVNEPFHRVSSTTIKKK